MANFASRTQWARAAVKVKLLKCNENNMSTKYCQGNLPPPSPDQNAISATYDNISYKGDKGEKIRVSYNLNIYKRHTSLYIASGHRTIFTIC